MRRALTSLVLLVFCLSACAGETASGPVQTVSPEPTPTTAAEPVSFSLPYYPNASLHPITGDNAVNRILGALVYQGLFQLDNSFSPSGVLCAGHTVSADGLTWTFSLKTAFFSDGTLLTAQHVAYSLELARTSTLYAARLADVTAVTAGEDGTVSVILSRPNGALPALLDIPVVWDGGDGGLPLGTGPYAFVEDSGPLRLARRSTAPDTAPEEIPLVAIEGADDLIHAFDAGNISLVVSDLTGANALGYSTGYEAFGFPTTTMLYVGFQAAEGPCQEPLIRRAVSRSFDRDTVTASLLAGHGSATCLPFSPRCALYSERHERAGGYSPYFAGALLAEAGCAAGEDGLLYLDGAPLSLRFIVNTDNSFKLSVADYLAKQLTDLGIAVELRKLSWDDYTAALEAGEFDLYLGETILTADFDLTALLSAEGVMNYGGYVNEDLTALLELLRGAREEQRATYAGILLTRFQAETPFAPLCFKSSSVLIQWRAVSGLEPTRQDPFYHLENLRFGA